MIEEILPKLYRVEIPLPRNPLRALNSYMIKDNGRALIIDTGMNREECLDVMRESIGKLAIDLDKTDFFITHMHADHLGLAYTLATPTSKVYFNKLEAEHVITPGKWEWGALTTEFARLNGFPPDELKLAISTHPGLKYSATQFPKFTILKQGDNLTIGDYSFRCIETPGHTKGHLCLYEPEKQIFVSGDHVLGDITPNISSRFNDDENPLKQYISSLDKVYTLEVKLCLPGHRSLIPDFRRRINELKRHHDSRAGEVLDILRQASQDAFQVASRMTWDMTYKSWDEFPPFQKWFAFGEALAHLHYVADRGEARRIILPGDKIIFGVD